MPTFTTTEPDKDQRLDKYLASKLSDTTRSQIKKMILSGAITVNNNLPSVHQFLNIDDVIKIEKDTSDKMKKLIPKITILAQTDDFIVVNKPAGVLSHQSTSDLTSPVLTDWFINNFPESKTVGDTSRPGIVHRLDKDVSGVMIIAKTQKMFNHLKQQFYDRAIKKTYTALIHDHLPTLVGQIDKPIGRSKNEPRMAARVQSLDAKDKQAITDFEVIKRYQKFDFIQAHPLTGRTHQIRVHLMSMGTPIVGDNLYAIHGQKKVVDLGRIFLHASEISFTDLDNTLHTTKSSLPKDLKKYLSKQKV